VYPQSQLLQQNQLCHPNPSTLQLRLYNQQDALNWLRHQVMNDKIIDPTGEFKKMNSLLPKKRGQSNPTEPKRLNKLLTGAATTV
jgi:hypothetical protein